MELNFDPGLEMAPKSSLPYYRSRRYNKMTEWLNQYERVAQRQQEYLQKIRDLRQRLQTRDERYMMLAIERMRHTPRDWSSQPPLGPPQPNPYYKSHVPWSSSILTHSFYPKTSAPSPRLLESSEGPPDGSSPCPCIVAGERLHPKPAHPKRLTPIPRKRRASSEKMDSSRSPGPGLERNKTDYEPIEDIAKRNRIHFSRYLNSRDEKREDGGRPGRDVFGTLRPLSTKANAGDDIRHRDV